MTRAGRRCPVCRKPVERAAPSFPFCSARCRFVDLGEWFAERYRVTRSLDPDDDRDPRDEDGREGEE